jgi:hypothetical protein
MESHLIKIDYWEFTKGILVWTWTAIKLFITTLGWKGFLLLVGVPILFAVIVRKIRNKISP